ncbi:MAG: DinB family protein [Acidimicrobiales bacterium]|nr:DinB family protein [Acidimicrobiales bacterium]
MTIQPDDKDWTWVIERQCPECGFDAGATDARDVSAMLREATADWAAVLTTRADVRDRPSPDVWSPLEYGCHVRDVFEVYEGRLGRMLNEDGPHYENWDQDETALASNYSAQDPLVVAAEVETLGNNLADLFDTVIGEQWDRDGYRSDGAAFTIDTFARYFIHDIVHHLVDVGARPR